MSASKNMSYGSINATDKVRLELAASPVACNRMGAVKPCVPQLDLPQYFSVQSAGSNCKWNPIIRLGTLFASGVLERVTWELGTNVNDPNLL